MLAALHDDACRSLDLGGMPVTDVGLAALAPRCAHLRALDVRRCPLLTGAHTWQRLPVRCVDARARGAGAGLRALLAATAELQVLRWGCARPHARQAAHASHTWLPAPQGLSAERPRSARGAACAAAGAAARRSRCRLGGGGVAARDVQRSAPALSAVARGGRAERGAAGAEVPTHHAAAATPGRRRSSAACPGSARSRRHLRRARLRCSAHTQRRTDAAAAAARRARVRSRRGGPGGGAGRTSARGCAALVVPFGCAALSDWHLPRVRAALAPLLDAADEPAAPATFVHASKASAAAVVHIAELFRRAYEARDLRLAPKRAKNARQRLRRQLAGSGGTEGALARCGAPALVRVRLADLSLADGLLLED